MVSNTAGATSSPLGNSTNDFPATSFFDIYADVQIQSPSNGLQIITLTNDTVYNPVGIPNVPLAGTNILSQPLVLQNTALTGFPPTVAYIHTGPAAVPVFFGPLGIDGSGLDAGDELGLLLLAGHGVFGPVVTFDGQNLYELPVPLGSDGQTPAVVFNSLGQPVLNSTPDLPYSQWGTATDPVLAETAWANPVSGTWSDSTKWSAGVPYQDGAVAFTNAATAGNLTVTLTAAQSIGTLVLGAGGLGGGYNLAASGAGSLTFSNTSYTFPASLEVIDGIHSITAPVVLASNLVVTFDRVAPWTLTFGTVGISDNGAGLSLTMAAGNGTLVLEGRSYYIGGTVVDAGDLRLDNPYALGYGSVTVNGGTVDLNGNSPAVLGFSGLTGGFVTNTAPSTTATLTLFTIQNTLSYSGTIADGAGVVTLAFYGPNEFVLSGTNTYSGGTYVEGGTLIATNPEAIANGTNLYVGSAGELTLFGGAIPSSATAAVPEPGTLALLAAGALVAFAAWRRRRN